MNGQTPEGLPRQVTLKEQARDTGRRIVDWSHRQYKEALSNVFDPKLKSPFSDRIQSRVEAWLATPLAAATVPAFISYVLSKGYEIASTPVHGWNDIREIGNYTLTISPEQVFAGGLLLGAGFGALALGRAAGLEAYKAVNWAANKVRNGLEKGGNFIREKLIGPERKPPPKPPSK